MSTKVHYMAAINFLGGLDATVFIAACGWAPALSSRKKSIRFTKKMGKVTCAKCKTELGMKALQEVP